jgi:hypothetical protein
LEDIRACIRWQGKRNFKEEIVAVVRAKARGQLEAAQVIKAGGREPRWRRGPDGGLMSHCGYVKSGAEINQPWCKEGRAGWVSPTWNIEDSIRGSSKINFIRPSTSLAKRNHGYQ